MDKRSIRVVSGSMLMALVVAAGFATDDDEKQRADALAKASITLSEAVTRAEAKTGGKALEAELEVKKDQAFFEIETVKDGVVVEVKIDAKSGEVTSTEEEKDKKPSKEAEAIKTATVTLAGAIVQAEAAAGGRAVEAELEGEKDQAVFEVGVLKDGVKIEVKIDPVSGKVLKVEKEEEDKEEKK
jgi:uncharacterized membrane protein YkoI